MGMLILSVAILGLVPVIYQAFHGRKAAFVKMDKVILFVTALLVCTKLLPASFAAIGWLALGLCLAGWALPYLFEHFLHHQFEKDVHLYSVGIICLALILHGIMDGFIIGQCERFEACDMSFGSALGWSVVLHRLPAGLFIWWVAVGLHGRGWASLYLWSMALSTILGYFADIAMDFGTESVIAVVQSVAAGSLLHLSFHDH